MDETQTSSYQEKILLRRSHLPVGRLKVNSNTHRNYANQKGLSQCLKAAETVGRSLCDCTRRCPATINECIAGHAPS
jgi:hypothetical protein